MRQETKPVKPITTRINTQLRKLGKVNGFDIRFVRGRGYYYVTGVACSSSLYAFWLDNTKDYAYARDHVNEVLKREGINFKVT